MKTNHFAGFIPLGLLSMALSLVVTTSARLAPPAITSIQESRGQVVVAVEVPSGIRRVTLECRERVNRRAWEPRAVARLDGSGGTVTFRLARSRALEVMRVRGDAAEPLPEAFYQGTNSFLGPVTSEAGPSVRYEYLDAATTATPGAAGGETREVVESDIWQIRGHTLYFFNQYRGLQIIDIQNPDEASARSTLELPAAGEQMYLLGENHVVLLARDGCNYDQSQVLVVEDANAGPKVVTSLPVTGSIQESRLVGTALYVAAQSYRPIANSDNTTWEWGTLVSAYDLSDPKAPAARNTLWYSGYGNVVSATDTLFFVATQHRTNWWQSSIGIIDITDPNGTMNSYGALTTAGRVQDQFKLHYTGGVLTTISEDRRSTTTARIVTQLETWRVPHPSSMGPLGIGKLAQLELGHGESLRATRFDGDRVYIVTFFQIDPLWVVDLSDPSQPQITGSVEIPGWSTYIEPLGDRLVSVGVENRRVAVSLFNVSDPAAPTLSSRVLLGETYSWTEANYDEKALTVLPGAGLILVPFNGDFTNSYAAAVQLIDLGRDTLTARGRIESAFSYRRTAAYRDRILSISGWELASVDATDRDQPIITGRLPLAWAVDRVFLSGNYLVEIANGNSWNAMEGPSVHVALADLPHDFLNELSLTNLPILGAAVNGDKLYIAQGQTAYFYPMPLAEAAEGDPEPVPPNFLLTVINLGQLPEVQVLGQAVAPAEWLGYSSDWQALWPAPNVLVWSGGGNNYWWWDYPIGMPLDTLAVGASMIWRPYWGGNGGRLIAFDVDDSAAPKFVSDLNLTTNSWWSFSQAFTAEGLVYLSHQLSEYIIPEPTESSAPGGSSEPAQTKGMWVQRTYLNVVDYADPADPLARKPVSIPGTLVGLGNQGNLLYTTGTDWTNPNTTSWTEYLAASAYLGSEARLVDSLELPSQWPHPVQVAGINVFIGRPGESSNSGNRSSNLLENWILSSGGKFEQLSQVELAMPANVMADFDGMLAVQETDNALNLFAIGDAAGLHLIGRTRPSGCWWYDLNHADGNLMRGLWIPLGVYGVAHVPLEP